MSTQPERVMAAAALSRQGADNVVILAGWMERTIQQLAHKCAALELTPDWERVRVHIDDDEDFPLWTLRIIVEEKR